MEGMSSNAKKISELESSLEETKNLAHAAADEAAAEISRLEELLAVQQGATPAAAQRPSAHHQ